MTESENDPVPETVTETKSAAADPDLGTEIAKDVGAQDRDREIETEEAGPEIEQGIGIIAITETSPAKPLQREC